MTLVIEKVDGPWITVEWGKDSFRIPKYLVPGTVKEGDRIKIEVQLLSDTNRLRRPSSNYQVNELE